MEASNSASLMKMEPEILRGHIPAGHIPKPMVIADYVALVPHTLYLPRLCHMTMFFLHVLQGCRPDCQLDEC